jgi:hypothetical protein
VRSRTLLERLLSKLCCHPFRCQICRQRFRAWQRGDLSGAITDQREYERLAMNFPLSFSGDTGSGAGTVSDISINGCAFVSDTRPAENSVLRLALRISAELEPVAIEAAVARHARPDGRVGVEFLRVEPRERERLELFMRGLRRE